MTNAHAQMRRGVRAIRGIGVHAIGTRRLILLGIATAVLGVPAATAQSTKPGNKSGAANSHENTVRITPIGQRTGEFCARDRALLFEDPTGVRILYDPGVTVAGGYDHRLGEVDAILVSHSHYDHIGYRKLTQNPDDPQANCDNTPDGSAQTSNTNTAEITAVKNSVVFGNGGIVGFLIQKLTNMGVSLDGCVSGSGPFEILVPAPEPCIAFAGFGSTNILTRASGTPGVRINVVAALHSDDLANPPLLLPADGLGKALGDNGVGAYNGLASGFVLTFTNGLRVYLTGDTGPTSDMAFVVRDIYHPNLTVANMDGVNNMGPHEAAYAMKVLVRTAAVIPSHAEEIVTVNGKLQPGTLMAEFIRLLNSTPAYLPLSGRTMEFDGDAECVAGCAQY
jgi:L-ascorbate metabolism protein UlaG (beta-lactamase superfamily)